jgi:thioredoxin 1
MAEGVQKVDNANFATEVEKYKGTVLVDFSATWCPPCRILGPIIEEVSQAVAGRAKVVALDVDASGDTASRFNVLNVPTMIFFKNGKEVRRLVGVVPKEKIIQQIDELAK